MRIPFTSALLGLTVASIVACSAPAPEEEVEDDGSEASAIVEGKAAPTLHPSVGYLAREDGVRHCGGVLIAPNVVLTAAHCFMGPSRLHFGLGAFSKTKKVYQARPSGNDLTPYAFVHPKYGSNQEHDLAYMVLEQPVPASEAVPARIGDHQQLASCAVEVVGYGRTTKGANGLQSGFTDERKIATICTEGIDPTTGHLNARGQSGTTCVGDSGSGLMAAGPGADTLIGIVSGGDRCETGARIRFTSVAREAEFVNAALAAGRQR